MNRETKPGNSDLQTLPQKHGRNLLEKIPEKYRAISVLLVNTGCRRSEAISLRWSNIDLNNGFAVIEKDKRHREKVITLNAEVVELLKTLPRHAEDDRVFFWIPSDNAVTVAFRGAVKRAGIVNFRLHDLRHTAASHLAMAGHDIKTIQEFLGHNDIRQTTRYAHIARRTLKSASDSLNGKFSAKVEIKKENETDASNGWNCSFRDSPARTVSTNPITLPASLEVILSQFAWWYGTVGSRIKAGNLWAKS